MGVNNVTATNGAGNSQNVKRHPKEYLTEIEKNVFPRMDKNGDNKVTVKEVLDGLGLDNNGRFLSGLKEDSNEYKKLKELIDKVPDILKKYAGDDDLFSAQEYADFLNGNEWDAIIDQYRSSSNYAEIEMDRVDRSEHSNQNGKCEKNEVKDGLLKDLDRRFPDMDAEKQQEISGMINQIVDKHASGNIFTVEKYTEMLNDPNFKQIRKDYGIFPFYLKRQTEQSNKTNKNENEQVGIPDDVIIEEAEEIKD